ncbi:MAG: hypothetical protein QOE59_1801, partial [Actinomycetota bacterium]|nr:hypothetical protein [Actinomycetota bacterium]
MAFAEPALALVVAHCRERTSFGCPPRLCGSSWPSAVRGRDHRDFVDRCVEALLAGKLGAQDVASPKYWTSELQGTVKRLVEARFSRDRFFSGWLVSVVLF